MSYTTPPIEYMHALSSQSNTKEFSGRSAAKWIDIFVVAGIQYQMRYTMRSVQQIAYDMNFPNQSFFGKYFKAHVGCSPKVYRLRQYIGRFYELALSYMMSITRQIFNLSELA